MCITCSHGLYQCLRKDSRERSEDQRSNRFSFYLKVTTVRHAFTVTTLIHYGIVRELPEPEEQNYRPELRDSVD
jgi:hypothetical protein